jgi:ribosomal protein S18 acetylase RimI-like enzyme
MIIRLAGEGDIAEVRRLFIEYAEWLAIDLSFQNFEEELAQLPGDYAAPDGRLLVAEHEGRAAGCVALRRLDPERCEMKRLYIPPEYRGSGLGRQMVLAIMAEARAIGYRWMRLDTLPQMIGAQKLYESVGFREIEAYRFNPVPGTRFLEVDLTN